MYGNVHVGCHDGTRGETSKLECLSAQYIILFAVYLEIRDIVLILNPVAGYEFGLVLNAVAYKS